MVCNRRQPATAVDEDRHTSLGRKLEDRREAIVVERESLRSRVELDASRSAVETADRLVDRPFGGQVEAHERHESAAGALGVSQCSVVRRTEGWLTVGLVHAEHEGAGDPVGVHDPLELLVLAARAVDVVPEM